VVSYQVSDGSGGLVNQTETIRIGGTNDAPQIPLITVDLDARGVVNPEIGIKTYVIDVLPAGGILYSDSAMTQAVTAGMRLSPVDGIRQLYFKADASFTGKTLITYHAVDNKDGISANLGSSVTALLGSGREDQVTPIQIRLSATDVDGTIASFMIDQIPAGGTLYTRDEFGVEIVVSPNQVIQAASNGLTLFFKPDLNFNGDTSLRYHGIDNSGAPSSTAIGLIVINAINDAPVAAELTARGTEDVSPINVVLSASDVDGSIRSYVIESLPSNGILYTNSSMTNEVTLGMSVTSPSLFFKPALDFNGIAKFTYYAVDNNNAASESQTVNIAVASVNDAPIASNVAVTQPTGIASIVLVANDIKDGGRIDYYQINNTSANGTLYTDSAKTQVVTAGMRLTPEANGTVTLFFQPNVGFVGAATFTFRAVDDTGLSSNLASGVVNIPPSGAIVSDGYALRQGAEDTIIAVDLLLDVGSVNQYVIDSLPNNGSFYSDISASSSSLLPIGSSIGAINQRGTVYFKPDANFNGKVTFTYHAVTNNGDGSIGSSAIVEGAITVTPVNDAPTTSPVVLTPLNEDTTRDITSADLLANASDIEGNDLTVSDLKISSGKGDLLDNNDGTWTYKPALNDDSAVSFSYKIIDNGTSNSASDPKTVVGRATLNLLPVNDAPVALDVDAKGVEDALITVVLQANDSLDSLGRIMSYVIDTLPVSGNLFRDSAMTMKITSGMVLTSASNTLK
jgi:hypothetical protein